MKRILAFLSLTVFLFVFAGCTQTTDKAESVVSQSTSYTVKDSRGVDVTFDKAPEKIISLVPNDTEIVYALGLGEKLIAVSTYCNYPEDTKNKQKLESGAQMNVETVIGLKPDVLLLGRMYSAEELYKQVEDAGIKVVVTDATDLASTYTIIEMLGKALKAETKATEVVNTMKKGFEDIKEQVKGKPSPKVYLEVSAVAAGPWSCGKGTFPDDILTLIGAKNIFDDITGYQQVSEEQAINRNPEYIITVDAYTAAADPVAEIKGRKNWAGVAAIKNGKVFLANSDKLSIPGPRLVEAAKELADMIYS